MAHWAQDAVFYHLFPLGQCGAPERNDFHSAPVGRLEALSPWIRHAHDLGADALFLGPVFESGSHGYDTADYLQVDRRLGTHASLARCVGEARGLGMRTILDGVFGHVGREFWAFRDLREQGARSRYLGWFRGVSFERGNPLGDSFSYENWKGYWPLVRLELRNPEVREYLFAAIDQWIAEYGIDGLRLDTADWLDFDFLRALRSHCESRHPGFWLMGEVIHGDYRKWANPGMLHSVTNYECHKGLWSSLNDHNYFEVAFALNRQFGSGGIYHGLPLYNFADNHDVNRAASNLKDRAHLSTLYALLFTMPGVPSIYYGSELGIEGRRSDTADQMLRPSLRLDELLAGDRSLADAIAGLARLRHASPALRRGDYAQLRVASEQLAFLRTAPEETVVVALNASGQPAQLDLDLPRSGSLRDLLRPESPAEPCQKRARVAVPPRGVRVLRLEQSH